MWSPPKSEYDHYVVSLMRVRITKRVKREVQEVVKEQNVTSSNISFGDLIPGASYQLQVEAVYNRTKSYSVQQDVTLCKYTVLITASNHGSAGLKDNPLSCKCLQLANATQINVFLTKTNFDVYMFNFYYNFWRQSE